MAILQNFLGFGQSADLDVVFDHSEDRKMVEVKMDDGRKEKQLLYYDGETISGRVSVPDIILPYFMLTPVCHSFAGPGQLTQARPEAGAPWHQD